MQPKTRITIRIEQPTKPKLSTTPFGQPIVPKERLLDNDEMANEPEFSTWNSPYQDDIHALEEIIRKTEAVNWNIPSVPSVPVAATPHSPTASHLAPPAQLVPVPHAAPVRSAPRRMTSGPVYDELTEEQWSIDLPDDEGNGSARENGWYNHTTSIRNENGPSWGRVFLSVAAAIGTGALFGYLVLGLFTGEPLFPGKSNAGNLPSTQASSEAALSPSDKVPSATDVSVSTESTSPVNGEVAGESVQIDGNIYYMLQYGVFQNEESMEIAIGQLREKGFASASEINDGYRVYVGMTSSRDEADLLASQMPDTEVYIKPLGGDPITVSSDKLGLDGAKFVNASGNLMRKLARYSGIGLLEQQPQKLEAADQAALQEAQRQWEGTQASIDKMSGSLAEDARAMVLALNSAIGSMAEFNSKPSRFQLWNVQSAIMKALISDRNLRSAIESPAVC